LLQFARYCSIVQTLSLKYPGRDLDLEVTWRRWSPDHTIRCSISYTCFIGTDRNLNSVRRIRIFNHFVAIRPST